MIELLQFTYTLTQYLTFKKSSMTLLDNEKSFLGAQSKQVSIVVLCSRSTQNSR